MKGKRDKLKLFSGGELDCNELGEGGSWTNYQDPISSSIFLCLRCLGKVVPDFVRSFLRSAVGSTQFEANPVSIGILTFCAEIERI